MKVYNYLSKIISRIFKVVMSRLFITSFIIILEVLSVFIISNYFSRYSTFFSIVNIIISLIALIHLLSKNNHPAYKLSWAIIVLLFPYAGGVAYLVFANKKIPSKLRNIELLNDNRKKKTSLQTSLDKEIEEFDSEVAKLFRGVRGETYYSYFKNSKVKYFSSGDDFFKDLLLELKKAKSSIFLEFFIIARGQIYSEIFEILKERISCGVEVFLIYDDFGSITTADLEMINELEAIGVDVTVFNPMKLGSVSQLNYRTHRKIVVIDNKTAYTGGINLADEYANLYQKYGYWKDTGIKVIGEAVSNFSKMFLQVYYGTNQIDYTENDLKLKPHTSRSFEYVLPFSVAPSDNFSSAKNIHLNLIHAADKYFYIQTPYLIIDYDLTSALINSAKAGVDVRITVPGIPDKKTVFLVTKNNYKKLVENGVKVYEYTPGFMHSKLCVMDDKIMLMSGINMDFRSYFLNYECGALVANSKAIIDAKIDYLKTIKQCEEITLEKINSEPTYKKVLGYIFSIFGPLI